MNTNEKLTRWLGLCPHIWKWEEHNDGVQHGYLPRAYDGTCSECGIIVIGVTEKGKVTGRGFGYDPIDFTSSYDGLFTRLVTKLEREGCQITIQNQQQWYCQIYRGGDKPLPLRIDQHSNTLIEAVYMAIIQFIEYKNTMQRLANLGYID